MLPDPTVILYVLALSVALLVGSVFACFAAHHYLTVLESTAADPGVVTWIPETIGQFWIKAVYVGYLGVLCYIPALVLGRMVPEGTARTVIHGLVLALLFPLAQLCSMGGSSPWLPWSASVFNRLLRRPDVLVLYYLLTAPIVILLAVGYYGALRAPDLMLAILAVPLFTMALLLYARLLGMLASVVRVTEPLVRVKRKKKRRPPPVDLPAAAAQTLRKPPPSTRDTQPLISPLDGPITGYELACEEGASPLSRAESSAAGSSKPVVRAMLDPEEDKPYAVHDPEVAGVGDIPPEVFEPTPDDRRLYRLTDPPVAPPRLLTSEFFTFLHQSTTWAAWGITTILGLGVAVMNWLARSFRPVGGDF